MSHVINFEIPRDFENYLHRVGRTGRGKKKGQAISFCSSEEKEILREIESFLGKEITELEIEKNAIKVNNALDYQTNIEGIYAIGDVNIYPGKLKLILCGFHEATLMCQSVYNRLNPGKRYVLKYTTVSGIDGFDGTRKEAEKAVVKAID